MPGKDPMSNAANPSPTFSGPAYQCALEIVERLAKAGHTAYFAGGCVRDHLLGIPAKDFDIATDARPEQVQAIFGHRHTKLVGMAFGVVCIAVRQGSYRGNIEVATFRSDGNYSDGRHPDEVTYTSPENDAQRRDFTINGLFYDPLQQQVIDFVGGVRDLQAGVLRAIGKGEDRFREDKLRMLRAIRFAARFHLTLDPATELAIRQQASTLGVVSPERIAIEMRKILELDWRGWGLATLQQNGLLAVMLPPLEHAWSQLPDAQDLASRLLARLITLDFTQALAALLLPLTDPRMHLTLPPDRTDEDCDWQQPASVANYFKQRWRLSNGEVKDLLYYLQFPWVLLDDVAPPWSRVQPWLIDPRAERALELIEAFLEVHAPPPAPHEVASTPSPILRLEVARRCLHECREALTWPLEKRDPEPFLDGARLQELGVPMGPIFSRLLSQVRAFQLDGKLQGKAEAEAWVLTKPWEKDL